MAKANRVKRLFRKKLVVIYLVAIGILLIILHIANSLSGPAIGVVDKQYADNNYIGSKSLKPKTYNGQYLSFSYPARYNPLASDLSGQIIEAFNLYSNDNTNISISVGVQQEALSADTGVVYRKQNPSLYKETSASADALSFTSLSNGYESDAFIAHNGLVASIVLTAPNQAIAGNDLNVILSSLKWH